MHLQHARPAAVNAHTLPAPCPTLPVRDPEDDWGDKEQEAADVDVEDLQAWRERQQQQLQQTSQQQGGSELRRVVQLHRDAVHHCVTVFMRFSCTH